MQINADWSQRVVMDATAMNSIDSPSTIVKRKMLGRDGEHIARDTSLVGYEPGSRFFRHVHEQGEELFVLDGELCDDTGHFGNGGISRRDLLISLAQSSADDTWHACRISPR